MARLPVDHEDIERRPAAIEWILLRMEGGR
jgi:hypothetical protein